jgi:hypothetical protein
VASEIGSPSRSSRSGHRSPPRGGPALDDGALDDPQRGDPPSTIIEAELSPNPLASAGSHRVPGTFPPPPTAFPEDWPEFKNRGLVRRRGFEPPRGCPH